MTGMDIQLNYGASTKIVQGANTVFDLFRDLSIVTSKYHPYTSDDGHLKGVLCDVTVTAGTPDSTFEMFTVPNTWKLRNGVRKFYFLRNHMFREAGIKKSEMGTYGKLMRPYYDSRMANATNSATASPIYSHYKASEDPTNVPGQMEEIAYDGGEWTYSKFGTVPSYIEGVSGTGSETTLSPADEWDVHLCDENVVQATSSTGGTDSTVNFSSVGIIHSYNLDRQAVQVQTGDTSVGDDSPNNPLAALRSAGNQASGEILEIAKEQEEEAPPYDLADDGDSIEQSLEHRMVFPSIGGTHTFRNVFLPGGFFRAGSLSGLVTGVPFGVSINVLGVYECRDLA